MNFTDIFIRRPVFASVLSIILLLVGLASYTQLPFRQFPRVEATAVTVSTGYSGASAEIMESYISTPLENALSSVNNVDYMISNNKAGASNITLFFKLGTNIDTAANDVSDKVASVRWKLPKETNDPVIGKSDPNTHPILFMSYTSKTRSAADITDYIQRVVQPELGSISGVADVKVFGSQDYAMRLWLNPTRMAAKHVTPSDVKNALRANNLQTPTGTLEDKLQSFDVVARTDLKTPEQFRRLVIMNRGDQVIRISDIGEVELGATTPFASVFVNGVAGRMTGIVPRSDANPLSVSAAVKKAMRKIQKQLPPDLKATIVYDSTQFIDASIKEVQHTFLEAGLLVIVVIFLFLGSLRALWIPLVTIPLSIIGACSLMLLMGFTLNTLTMLALVLAIGLVVDDAIVVLENIHRHIEEGMTPVAAAIAGAREIKFAIIAMTMTLAAVYAPIGFKQGLTGVLFKEFAFTLAGAVIISGFIALTLSPMMCSKLLTKDSLDGKFSQFIDKLFSKIANGYSAVLRFVLRFRAVVILCFIGILFSCGYLFTIMPQELAPREDTGAIMSIMNGPASANLNYTEQSTKQFQAIVNTVPDIIGSVVINGWPNGVNSAMSFLILKPWSERKQSIGQVFMKLYPKLGAITDLSVMAFPLPPSLPGSTGNWDIDIALKTTKSYQELGQALDKLAQAVRANPKFINVDTTLKFDKPQVEVTVNRNKAGLMGISMSDIGDALNMVLGEPTVNQFEMNGKGYYVIPQVAKRYREKATDLNKLYLRTNKNEMVPLANLVSLKQNVVPRSLDHFQQLRSAKLTASLIPGYSPSEGLAFVERAIKNIGDKQIQYDYAGKTRQFVEESGQMIYLLMFAIMFIYLVLAAQFESFRDPLIVMLSVPLSITTALFVLLSVGGSLNVYTWIGLVTLVGLISKHGILMVEFANQLQEKGYELRDAIIESARVRLRPILMTTAAMVLGSIPLATASGAGAASRQQIGWVIVSGMSFGTLLTLFVVPVMYSLLATKKKVFTTGDAKSDELLGIHSHT